MAVLPLHSIELCNFFFSIDRRSRMSSRYPTYTNRSRPPRHRDDVFFLRGRYQGKEKDRMRACGPVDCTTDMSLSFAKGPRLAYVRLGRQNVQWNTETTKRSCTLGASTIVGVGRENHRGRWLRITRRAGGGIDGWFDLASFVATSTSSKSPFDDLSYSIGKECYVDIAGWHLFLKDIKVEGQTTMAQALAAKLGGDMMSSGFDDRNIEDALKKVPIKLGQGKMTVSLKDVMPSMVISDLMDICEEYARQNC